MVGRRASSAHEFWEQIIQRTFDGGYTGGSPLIIQKIGTNGSWPPNPAGAPRTLVRNVGELKGQLADWRASLDGTDQGFHAVEFKDRFECHMDAKDPFKDPMGHLVEDSPGTLAVVGAVAVLGVLGVLAYALSRRR